MKLLVCKIQSALLFTLLCSTLWSPYTLSFLFWLKRKKPKIHYVYTNVLNFRTGGCYESSQHFVISPGNLTGGKNENKESKIHFSEQGKLFLLHHCFCCCCCCLLLCLFWLKSAALGFVPFLAHTLFISVVYLFICVIISCHFISCWSKKSLYCIPSPLFLN